MLFAMQYLATFFCAIFAGAAVYINLAEHPARMSCDTKTAATVWVPSYQRAAHMQASLAVLSFVTGTGAWLLGGGVLWFVGALLIGLVVPFTLLVVKSTNDQLLAPGRDLASQETRRLLEKWGRLHAVRSVLSVVATAFYLLLIAKI